MREVVTLQVGSFANYVGAHFWNLQDELLGNDQAAGASWTQGCFDHDVLFSTGETPEGQITYTPRLLLVDHPGSYGGISSEHYGTPQPDELPIITTWHGNIEVQQQELVRPSAFVASLADETEEEEKEREGESEYGVEDEGRSASGGMGSVDAAALALRDSARELDSEGGVRFWTDYLKVVLHPRGGMQIPPTWLRGDSSFGGFGEGEGLLRNAGAKDEYSDRLRRLAEDCDTLQGFQCFVDDQSGFGGLACDLLGLLRDEFDRTPTLVYALRKSFAAPPLEAADLRRHRLNEACSLGRLSGMSILFTPLAPPPAHSLPYVTWKSGSLYHTSALLGAVVDGLTSPYRTRASSAADAPQGARSVQALAELLVPRPSFNLMSTAAALPPPPLPLGGASQQGSDPRLQRGHSGGEGSCSLGDFCHSWTPGIAQGGQCAAESVVLRGARRACETLRTSAAAAALDALLLAEVLLDPVAGTRAVRQRTIIPQALQLPLPFPRLFVPPVTRFGDRPPLQGASITSSGSEAMNSAAPSAAMANGNMVQTMEVESLPLLTRTAPSQHGATYAGQQLQSFQRISRSGPGMAVLRSWGWGSDEGEEVAQRLTTLSTHFEGDAYSSDSD